MLRDFITVPSGLLRPWYAIQGRLNLWYRLSFMPFPCKVSPCGVAGRVSSYSEWPRCCRWGCLCVPHWSDLTVDVVGFRLGLVDLPRLVSLTDGFLDHCSSSLTSLGLCVRVSHASFFSLRCLSHGVSSLLRVSVVNRAKSDIQVGLMAICSFYIKTNIVIPTCMSDDLPPVLPSSQCLLMLN